MHLEIDTTTVQLIGLGGIAELWDQPRPTVYSKWRRGQLAASPDWMVAIPAGKPLAAGVPVWLRQRFSEVPDEIDTTPYEGLPRLAGMDEIAICMDVRRKTIEVMRSRGRQDIKAPEPYDHIGKTPVWWLLPWQEFARLTGRPWHPDRLYTLDRERKETQ